MIILYILGEVPNTTGYPRNIEINTVVYSYGIVKEKYISKFACYWGQTAWPHADSLNFASHYLGKISSFLLTLTLTFTP